MDFLKSILRPIWNSPFIFRLRGLVFDFGEIVSGYRLEKNRFFENTGYHLDLKNPKSFSHHLVWKKIYDRNSALPIMADKYLARDYVKKVLGTDANNFLVPLLYVTPNPETIPFDDLKGEYIIKANHNSGPHFIVEKGISPNRYEIIKNLKKQLRTPYGILKHEWAYSKIKPIVVVERLLRDEDGKLPKDYKFHMVFGKCAFIQVDFDRATDHTRTLYDEKWNYLPVTLKFRQGREAIKPKNLDVMLNIAQRLSKGFDYLRVDLYAIEDRIYIGEMTHYPGSGVERFTPQSFDFTLGNLWNKNE